MSDKNTIHDKAERLYHAINRLPFTDRERAVTRALVGYRLSVAEGLADALAGLHSQLDPLCLPDDFARRAEAFARSSFGHIAIPVSREAFECVAEGALPDVRDTIDGLIRQKFITA
jgi:hypothetical protein